MAEDWRLTATIGEDAVKDVVSRLREHEADDDVRGRLGQAVAISTDDDTLFAYADSREAIDQAADVVRGLLREKGLATEIAVQRWHELEQAWEGEDVPLPQTEPERRAEHERLEAEETAESRAAGRALWEVRLELQSHHETRELAQRLEDEGLPVIARWRYLLVGAESEDDARSLAERLRTEAPHASVQVEPSGEMVAGVAPSNPFAIFGGLAG